MPINGPQSRPSRGLRQPVSPVLCPVFEEPPLDRVQHDVPFALARTRSLLEGRSVLDDTRLATLAGTTLDDSAHLLHDLPPCPAPLHREDYRRRPVSPDRHSQMDPAAARRVRLEKRCRAVGTALYDAMVSEEIGFNVTGMTVKLHFEEKKPRYSHPLAEWDPRDPKCAQRDADSDDQEYPEAN